VSDAVAPGRLRDQTLRQLRETRGAMMELSYLLAADRLPPAEKRLAKAQLAEVQKAYLQLRAARLEEIRDGLRAAESDLREGLAGLEAARGRIATIRSLMKATGTVLRILGRVLA